LGLKFFESFSYYDEDNRQEMKKPFWTFQIIVHALLDDSDEKNLIQKTSDNSITTLAAIQNLGSVSTDNESMVSKKILRPVDNSLTVSKVVFIWTFEDASRNTT
jgi:hypothetical protein